MKYADCRPHPSNDYVVEQECHTANVVGIESSRTHLPHQDHDRGHQLYVWPSLVEDQKPRTLHRESKLGS